ncbi:glycosyltransferase [Agathobacter sp.]
MRVFDFTLLSGYEFSGVDVAQGFRARLFAKNNVDAKFIFTELPTIRDMELYGSQKIKRGQIMSAHLFMTGRADMSLSVKKETLLENEKENYEYDDIDENGKMICLYNSGDKIVEILCDEDGFVINESLFKNGKKYLVNYYTDSLSYTELYNWDNDSNNGLNPERRIFWNRQGQMVYEQCIYVDKVEYLFKESEIIDNIGFVERFVKALDLCENDVCIMDRAGYLDYMQPLFENRGKSKLVAVLHSDHFYKMYENEGSLYMNYEYYYWFKYSEAIDYFVVGTDEHKRSLEAFLKEYDCFVPHVAAIPPGAIPEGKIKSKNERRRGSIISASRLSPRKGIDILIKSVIKAHEINQTINLDIYGSGDDEYTIYLQNIVKDAGADDYIHFKGHCNLKKSYPHYELFASFSLCETFGLSLMEAVGDGLAMVGLDVRYGNRLFIHPDENGYLVDFDVETDFQNKDKLCERTAAAIVKIFEDDNRLKKFHENSYKIAEEYKEHVIESKWMQLIKNIPYLNSSNLIS